jgi:hypothetical protein
MSAFFIYSKDHYGAVRAEHPDWKQGDISKHLGQKWNSMSESEKRPFQQVFEQYKTKYDADLAAYQHDHDPTVVHMEVEKPATEESSEEEEEDSSSEEDKPTMTSLPIKATKPADKKKKLVAKPEPPKALEPFTKLPVKPVVVESDFSTPKKKKKKTEEVPEEGSAKKKKKKKKEQV